MADSAYGLGFAVAGVGSVISDERALAAVAGRNGMAFGRNERGCERVRECVPECVRVGVVFLVIWCRCPPVRLSLSWYVLSCLVLPCLAVCICLCAYLSDLYMSRLVNFNSSNKSKWK